MNYGAKDFVRCTIMLSLLRPSNSELGMDRDCASETSTNFTISNTTSSITDTQGYQSE